MNKMFKSLTVILLVVLCCPFQVCRSNPTGPPRKIRIVFSLKTFLPPKISEAEFQQLLSMPEEENGTVFIPDSSATHHLEDSLAHIARIRSLFSSWQWRVGEQTFGFTTDTLEFQLPSQPLDTLFIKTTGRGKSKNSYYLLRFREGFTYSINLDVDELSWSIVGSKETPPLLVSFQIENYLGSDKMIAKAGKGGEEIALMNHQKTDYYQAISSNQWYNWGHFGLYPLSIINKSQEKKRPVSNKEHFVVSVPFQELHGEKVDVSYDFKTQKAKIAIVE